MTGYRTYFFAAAIAALAGVHYLGLIDNQAYQALLGLFGAGGLGALRLGISKIQK